jgi:uncharacterized iron-regulated membrane protein
MRKLIFTIHGWLGLIAGLFLVLLSLTGALMAFEPEIDHLVHHAVSYVPRGENPLPLATLGRAVIRAFPADTIVAYGPDAAPDLSWAVYLQQRIVYVNPYTGQVLGSLQRPDQWDRWQNNIHQLHLRLAFRDSSDTGKKIMSWAGLALLLMELTGLFLWWKQKTFGLRPRGQSGNRSAAQSRQSLAQSRQSWFDWHNMIAIFSSVFVLLLTLTGVFIGFERSTVPLVEKWTGTSPLEVPDAKPSYTTGAMAISADSAMTVARKALPGAAPFNINIPDTGQVYVARCRFPEDRTPGGRSMVIIDPYTAKPLFIRSSRTAPLVTRIINTNRALHTGDIFGMPSKIILSLACLSVVILFLTGSVMWWKRRRLLYHNRTLL